MSSKKFLVDADLNNNKLLNSTIGVNTFLYTTTGAMSFGTNGLQINDDGVRDVIHSGNIGNYASTATASNGLTKTGNDIQLGGTLIENTVINGNYSLSLGEFSNKINGLNVNATGQLNFQTTYDGGGGGFQLISQNVGLGGFAGIYVTGSSNNLTVEAVDITLYANGGGNQINTTGSDFNIRADFGLTISGLAEYNTDYSSSYTNRSLVDKEYVDDVVSGGAFTLTNGNGTTANDTAVDLGGALNANVNITGSSYNVNYDVGSITLESYFSGTAGTAGGTSQLYLNGPNFTISGTSGVGFKGAVYGDDYSNYFVNRSLVDKEYVDTVVDNVTLNNGSGTTASGKSVNLGGNLSQNVNIDGVSIYDYSIYYICTWTKNRSTSKHKII